MDRNRAECPPTEACKWGSGRSSISQQAEQGQVTALTSSLVFLQYVAFIACHVIFVNVWPHCAPALSVRKHLLTVCCNDTRSQTFKQGTRVHQCSVHALIEYGYGSASAQAAMSLAIPALASRLDHCCPGVAFANLTSTLVLPSSTLHCAISIFFAVPSHPTC
jgi:hypothetical protein